MFNGPRPSPARVAATVAARREKAAKPEPPPEPVADQHGQFPPELVDQFHAAREVVTAQIQALLIKAQSVSEDDEEKYRELHEEIAQLSKQRGGLAVGSAQVREVLDAAEQRRAEQFQRSQQVALQTSTPAAQ